VNRRSGKATTGAEASAVLDAGCDVVMLGSAAILESSRPADAPAYHATANPDLSFDLSWTRAA
jgi:hypothetical protein